MTTAQRTLRALASHQHGVVSALQVRQHGITQKAIQSLLARGVLTKDVRGVYRFPDEKQVEFQAHAVAVLWTQRESAAISHATALVVRGLPNLTDDEKIHVTVSKKERIRIQPLENIELHYADIDPLQVEQVNSLNTVNVATALRQVIADSPRHTGVDEAINQALEAGYISEAEAQELAGLI